MASMKRDVESIVDRLSQDYGCTVRVTKAGHWRVTRPGYQSVTMARTPSDKRALANMKGDIRRYLGVDLGA